MGQPKADAEAGAPTPGMVPSQMTADIQRQQLWNQPKDIMPLIQDHRIRYKNADKQKVVRDLVVIKAKNASAMVEKASKLISNGSRKQGNLVRMMRHGRENFARDVVSEMNRSGMRAFKYRSGQRDLRNEEEFRRVEKRRPDHQRKRFRGLKRRWMESGRNAPSRRWVSKNTAVRKR